MPIQNDKLLANAKTLMELPPKKREEILARQDERRSVASAALPPMTEAERRAGFRSQTWPDGSALIVTEKGITLVEAQEPYTLSPGPATGSKSVDTNPSNLTDAKKDACGDH